MHGTSDDNVHFQNSLALLDKLDLDAVNNYDVHVFPDSDHGIYFHGAYAAVHQREFFSFSFVFVSFWGVFVMMLIGIRRFIGLARQRVQW